MNTVTIGTITYRLLPADAGDDGVPTCWRRRSGGR